MRARACQSQEHARKGNASRAYYVVQSLQQWYQFRERRIHQRWQCCVPERSACHFAHTGAEPGTGQRAAKHCDGRKTQTPRKVHRCAHGDARFAKSVQHICITTLCARPRGVVQANGWPCAISEQVWYCTDHGGVSRASFAAWQKQYVLCVKVDEDTIGLSLLKANHTTAEDHDNDFELGRFRQTVNVYHGSSPSLHPRVDTRLNATLTPCATPACLTAHRAHCLWVFGRSLREVAVQVCLCKQGTSWRCPAAVPPAIPSRRTAVPCTNPPPDARRELCDPDGSHHTVPGVLPDRAASCCLSHRPAA